VHSPPPLAWQGLGRPPGLGLVACLVTKCRPQLVACLRDATCKACVDCLNACPANDQVRVYPMWYILYSNRI
jgi:hypothetical protein